MEGEVHKIGGGRGEDGFQWFNAAHYLILRAEE